MATKSKTPTSHVPVWNIPRLDPGYIYIIQAGGRLKVGKSKHRESRVRDARTWLPDMTLIGSKPFWNVRYLERDLHEGLAQWWYEGEWFHPGDDPYLENFLFNFRAFSDSDEKRDMNSVNFSYWMHDMLEISMERAHRRLSIRAFQREVSDARKSK